MSGAGLALGAFTSRFLAENFYHALPGLNSLPQTILLSLAVTLALLAFWLLYSAAFARQVKEPLAQALADDALTYTPLFLLLFYLIQREVNPLQATVLLGGCLLLVIALKTKTLLRIGSWKLEVGSWNFGLVIDHWSLVIGSGLFALTFVVYLSTLSPTLGEADSFEFQVVSHTLGVAHPTGYPLYILLGKLFTLLPVGNVAYRVNLISPLFASLAIVYLYLCLMHLTRHRAASLLAALTFAFSRTFWSQAVIAEVYTLNAFFVAFVLYLLLEVRDWRFSRSRIPSRGGSHAAGSRAWEPALLQNRDLLRLEVGGVDRRIGEIAFVYGLSLTNHLTMALLAPAIAIYTVLTKRHSFASVSRSDLAQPGSPDPGQKQGFGNPLRAILGPLSVRDVEEIKHPKIQQRRLP
ncbi:MAG: DUF2723 domain-containing protein, partial [Anaerolineales bacterium]|nr:DUF2723 domain-containing protein [Anaerolineales bacterium]